MYSYIKGVLAELEEDAIVVETGGIGYHIYTTGQTFSRLPSLGDEVKIYTYLYIREDAMLLYGFCSKDELRVFKLLLGVSGIGPKGALAILSVMTTDDLRFAVLSGDAKAISAAPGIGKKTAEKLIIELKDKLNLEEVLENKANGDGFQESNTSGGTSEIQSEAVQALVALGYGSTESLRAVKKVSAECETVEDVLKAALKNLF